jgi:hypothetical protein
MKESITREQLKELYETMTVAEMAAKLNVSLVGLYKLLDSAGIARKKAKRTVYEVAE